MKLPEWRLCNLRFRRSKKTRMTKWERNIKNEIQEDARYHISSKDENVLTTIWCRKETEMLVNETLDPGFWSMINSFKTIKLYGGTLLVYRVELFCLSSQPYLSKSFGKRQISKMSSYLRRNQKKFFHLAHWCNQLKLTCLVSKSE